MLLATMTMGETLHALPREEQGPASRFWFKSPCYFVRTVDVTVHVVLPKLLNHTIGATRFARWLRVTSPRWGRSWRDWQENA